MTERSPFEVLFDLYLRSFVFKENEGYVEQYLADHRTVGIDPYNSCEDFSCRNARDYAHEILNCLKVNQLGVSHTIYLTQRAFDELQDEIAAPPKVHDGLLVALSDHVERTFVDDQALARHMAATYPGRWVMIGVRQTVLGADEDPAKLITRFGHRSDVRLVYQERSDADR